MSGKLEMLCENRPACWRVRVKLILTVLLLLGLPSALRAGEKRPKSIKVVGFTTVIEPARITITTEDGRELTVVPTEDFISRVGLGSRVTVWYTPRDGVNYLDWMQYPLENFFAPGNEIREGIRRIIILPNSGVPDSEGLMDRIGNYLGDNLGWYVAPAMLAEEIHHRFRGSASTLDAIDPATGHVNMERYVRAQRSLIKKIASETRVDAVLEVSVERVEARFTGQVAAWDGVTERVATKGVQALTILSRFPADGVTPAATAVMRLWDPQGKLLWTNRRGFAILSVQTAVGNRFRDRPLSEVYDNEPGMQAWLALALGGLAPGKTPPAETAANPHKKSSLP